MSDTYTKIEYICQCGRDYGSCGEIGKFFLKDQGVSDTCQLSWQRHPDEEIECLGWFNYESITALEQLLTKPYDLLGKCSDEEAMSINKIKCT